MEAKSIELLWISFLEPEPLPNLVRFVLGQQL